MSQKNEQQVLSATKAINAAYGKTCASSDTEELELHVSDLLCDLMHFCDAKEIDWSNCISRAEGHHRYETKHEEVM